MQRTNYEPFMDDEDVNNFANKKHVSAECDVVRNVFTALSATIHSILTPESILEVFQQLGIDAGEKGSPCSKNPFPISKHTSSFGRLCRTAWHAGWQAGSKGRRSNRHAK